MWFYRQAQRIPQTPQAHVEEKIEARLEQPTQRILQTPQREVDEKIASVQAHTHVHGREVVHAVENAAKLAERTLENVVEHAGPVADWFVEAMRPLERKLESVTEEKIEHLMDKNGWWKDDQLQ